VWVKVEGPQRQATVVSLAEQGREITLGIDGLHAFARYSGGGPSVTVTQTGGEFSSGEWHHLALTAGAGQITLYVDGVMAGQTASALQEIGGNLSIGSSFAGGNFFAGELDEVSVAKVARSAAWIKAVARGQGATSTEIIYGADGQKEGGGQASYFITIAKNLTVDGWVVIVICMTMLVVALAIMVFKAVFLSKVEKANGSFLRDYHQMSATADSTATGVKATEGKAAVAALAEHRAKYASSTLFELYHMGIAELGKRVDVAGGGAHTAVLSAQSIEAIRASMDATQTRAQQRLSAQMVLLTIAISGGPFLGLLGTVIGVMITFAAIALSGDVNINAIAPGTAAALAATVAGLGVAIPCLFGYNWLNTRIKSIAANNRVFLDEFVARLAEQYC
jgi:biopolymer transport protein ExbB